MSDVLNSRITLRVNAGWQRIGFSTPAEAFVSMTGGDTKNPPALALDIEYELGPDGKPDWTKLASVVPKPWSEWIKLPIREGDMAVSTVNMKIRVPTVILCPKYHKMPIKKLRPTKVGIKIRDKNTCQYTGVELNNKTFSLDHRIPKSKGGKDTWENLVACHKDVNSKKGNSYNEEVGLKLLKNPVAPKPIPLCELIRDIKHSDHVFF